MKLNMNRLFKDEYESEIDTDAYEFRRAQELKTILRDCDYFLDFHSAPIAQEPFLVAEGKSLSFFTGLGLPRIISGWSKFSAGPTGGDAETYANTHGAIAATLESGSHFDKRSNDVAYAAAISFLSTAEHDRRGAVSALRQPPRSSRCTRSSPRKPTTSATRRMSGIFSFSRRVKASPIRTASR